jgi:hypothetical protein
VGTVASGVKEIKTAVIESGVPANDILAPVYANAKSIDSNQVFSHSISVSENSDAGTRTTRAGEALGSRRAGRGRDLIIGHGIARSKYINTAVNETTALHGISCHLIIIALNGNCARATTTYCIVDQPVVITLNSYSGIASKVRYVFDRVFTLTAEYKASDSIDAYGSILKCCASTCQNQCVAV